MKICTNCHEEKEDKEFLLRADRPAKRYARCKICQKIIRDRIANGEYPYSNRNCKFCGEEFKPKTPIHIFCDPKCKMKWSNKYGSMEVHKQYEKLNGNWRAYFNRLINQKGPKRKLLTPEILIQLLEKQNNKCALSGVELTCKLILGQKCGTNASIDRIIPGSMGGDYSINNIRLLCNVVNKMRQNLTDEEFISWCKMISEGGNSRAIST